MQTTHLLVLAIVGLGLAVTTSPHGQENSPVVPAVRRVDLERELELVARVEGTTPTYSWWPLSITVELVNRSHSVSYPIVLPGDGSDAGWREPHVFFTTEILAQDGTWSAVPQRGGGRCGNYDPYWLDEVVQLTPGATQRLQWFPEPALPDHGKIRLRAHYVYAARPSGPKYSEKDQTQTLGHGGMVGVEPFELVSAPLEFVLEVPGATQAEIERDVTLEVTRDGAGPAYSWELQRFHVRLTNRSATRTHRVVRPTFVKKDGWHEPRIREDIRVNSGDGRWRGADRLWGGFYDGPIDDTFLRPEQLDWRSQVIELLPGQSIDGDLPASLALHEFHGARTASIVIEYAYGGHPISDANGTRAAAPEGLGAMAAVPPFRLRSNEITWQVRSPLSLEIVPRADRDPLGASSLTDRLRIVLRNEGDEPIEISSSQSAAKLEVSASQLLLGGHAVDVRGTLGIERLVIPARSELSLLEDPAVDVRALWTSAGGPSPDPGRVQALLHRPGWIHSFNADCKFTAK